MIRGAGRLRRYTDEPTCAAHEDGYWCSLPVGHRGQHEAHGHLDYPLAVWGDVVRDGRHLMPQDDIQNDADAAEARRLMGCE